MTPDELLRKAFLAFHQIPFMRPPSAIRTRRTNRVQMKRPEHWRPRPNRIASLASIESCGTSMPELMR
jgi:hypothetical protein